MPIALSTLTTKIIQAFDGISRENAITLHEAEELDNRGSPEELAQARKLDTDTRWQEVKPEWIEKFSCAIDFLNVKGLLYYLPAVMLWDISKSDSANPSAYDGSATAADNLESGLMRPSRKFSTLIENLTEPQCQAVACWLYLRAPEHYKETVRNSCWGNYLPSSNSSGN